MGVTTIHRIPSPYAISHFIEVYGDPDNGWYEWRVVSPDGKSVFQDTGKENGGSGRQYGITGIALRDALMVETDFEDPHLAAMRHVRDSTHFACKVVRSTPPINTQGASMESPTITRDLAAYLPRQPIPELDGVSAGIMTTEDGTHYCLVIPNDPATDIADLEWGACGKRIEGARSTWDGLENSRALAASGLDLPAIDAIARLNSGNEENPFYLPSQRELALCWATVPHLFQTDDWYWSSTQCSDDNAWYQSFDDGDQDIDNKDFKGRVRAVRRLIIQ